MKKLQVFFYGYLIFFSLSTVLLSSCFANKTSEFRNKGELLFITSTFDSTRHTYMRHSESLPDNKILYTDKYIIAAVPGVDLGLNDRKYDSSFIMFYVFLDLEKMLFFKYHQLSDTASAFQIYNLKQADTVHGGMTWRFYESNKLYGKGYNQEKLNDTVIKNHTYKQNRIINHSGSDSLKYTSTTFLSDCSIKDRRFQIFKNMDTLTGCPVTKIVVTGYPYNHLNYMGEIKFERNYLTEQEEKVFKAWEQNAKKYEASLLKEK